MFRGLARYAVHAVVVGLLRAALKQNAGQIAGRDGKVHALELRLVDAAHRIDLIAFKHRRQVGFPNQSVRVLKSLRESAERGWMRVVRTIRALCPRANCPFGEDCLDVLLGELLDTHTRMQWRHGPIMFADALGAAAVDELRDWGK